MTFDPTPEDVEVAKALVSVLHLPKGPLVAALRRFADLVEQSGSPGTTEHDGVVGTFIHGGCGRAHFPDEPCP